MLYKSLCARGMAQHDTELIEKIRLLYEGGFKGRDRLAKLITMAPGETPTQFNYRKSYASYMGYMGQLVDYLIGCLFQANLHMAPAGDAADPTTVGALPDDVFYARFASDADLEGQPFSEIMRCASTEALLCQTAWICVDMPKKGELEYRNRIEELEHGADRGYCYVVPYEEVRDYCEADGQLTWLIDGKVFLTRDDPELGYQKFERYTLWRRDKESGDVTYEVFETERVKPDYEFKPGYDVPSVEKETTSFREIPYVKLTLPAGLWAGNKIGPLAEEHFRRRSDLVGSMARSLFEIPYVKQGPEIPGIGEGISEAQTDPSRGQDPVGQFKRKGWVTLGADDEIGFAGPTGRAYEVSDKQLQELREEIFRAVHTMSLSVPTTSAAVGRSGDSKAEDREATSIVLGYLAEKVRELASRVYRVLSQARGEDVVWTAHGLDAYDTQSLNDLLTEATLVQGLLLPSATFQKEYRTRIALRAVNAVSPETKDTIKQELADAVDELGVEVFGPFPTVKGGAPEGGASAGGGKPSQGGSPERNDQRLPRGQTTTKNGGNAKGGTPTTADGVKKAAKKSKSPPTSTGAASRSSR